MVSTRPTTVDSPFSSPDTSPKDLDVLQPIRPAHFSYEDKPVVNVFRRHKPRRHPFFTKFEAPHWIMILTHVLICGIAYPVLFTVDHLAKRHTLFWTRFIVSMEITVAGIAIGFSLTMIGSRLFESSAWATTIHQTQAADAPGISLRELARRVSDPPSLWLGLKLLWERTRVPYASRKHYDQKWWSIYILFFLAIALLANAVAFSLDRVIDILTVLEHQTQEYTEVSVAGALSPADLRQAQVVQDALENFEFAWTLKPSSGGGGVPPPVRFLWNGDDVYFAEAIKSQFVANGTGLGTYDFLDDSSEGLSPTTNLDVENRTVDLKQPVEQGHLVRSPRFGIRIHCERIPEPEIHIIPRARSGTTYLLATQSLLQSLFQHFKMELPGRFGRSVAASSFLQANDTLPRNVDASNIFWAASFPDNGMAHSFQSETMSMGDGSSGFISLDAVMVRLNTEFAPRGRFAHTVRTDRNTVLGYDALLCLEVYEPYIVETYNSTISNAATIGIVAKSAVTVPGRNQKFVGQTLEGQVNRELNSTGWETVHAALNTNSMNRLIKDNGPPNYVPNPTVLSFTGNSGPRNYTQLSPIHFARVKSIADATNILPFLAGSGKIYALAYPDFILASAKVAPIALAIVIGSMLLVGVIAGLCVPKLPHGVPRRDFRMFSWMAAMNGGDFVGETDIVLDKHIDLDDLEEHVGQVRYRFNQS